MLGAPAGYVGYDDGGTLTDRVRRQPYSVVLFDEIEKAHPDVMNLLLQILEDGRLTDSHGRSVSFGQTIVILTSNVGAEQMIRESEIGFSRSTNSKKQSDETHSHNSQVAKQELEKFMRPELISRFDNIVVFKPLTKTIAGKIFDNLVKEMAKSVASKGLKLKITPSAKRYVINQGFDAKRGARSLRRTLQSLIGDPLSDVLISDNIEEGSLLKVKYRNEGVKIDVENPTAT